MRAYVNAQKPQTISAIIHHSMLAHKIFYNSQKVASRPNEKGEKNVEKTPVASSNNNKKPNPVVVAKKQEKKPYKGTNRLTPEEIKRYKKNKYLP